MIDNQTLIKIMSYITIMVVCIVFKVVFSRIKEPVKSNLFANVLLTLIITILIIIDTFYVYDGAFKYTICLVSFLAIYSKTIYDINWFDNIMYTTMYIYMYKIVEYTLFWCIVKINSQNYNYLTIEIESFIVTILFLILSTKLVDSIKNTGTNKIYYIFIAVAIIANIITTVFSFIIDKSTFYSMNVFLNIGGNILSIMLPWIMIVCNILLILIVKKLVKDANIRAENKVIKEKMDMQYKYYLSLQESQSKVKKLYHDINNHMICIRNIYESNNSVSLYLDSIDSEIQEYKSIYNTENMILDIILSEKDSICINKNIQFSADINFSKCGFIEMIDVCSIFSNILDNAIEACIKINGSCLNKEIKIRGTIVKNYFVIKCENTKINKIDLHHNKIRTSKKDKFIHGIGLESVKSSLKKYDGELELEDFDNKFIVKIYIPLQ